MKFNRKLLAIELSIIAPATTDKAKIPGLDCIWFDGKTVSAYNDLLGIVKPLETEFQGGLPGKILIGYLEKTDTDEIDIELQPAKKTNPETGEVYQDVKLTAGKSVLTLPLRSKESQPWSIPEADMAGSIILTKNILNAFELVLVGTGKEDQFPEQQGVTLESAEDTLNLYTTDAVALSWCQLDLPKNYTCDRITIPDAFCRQLLELCRPEDAIYLSSNCVIAKNTVGTLIFGRVLEVENPKNFAGVIENKVPPHEMISMPPGLEASLGRVALLKSDLAEISIEGSTLSIYAKTMYGEIKDTLDVEENHPQMQATLSPALIHRALSERTFFSLSKTAMAMAGPANFLHLISAITK